MPGLHGIEGYCIAGMLGCKICGVYFNIFEGVSLFYLCYYSMLARVNVRCWQEIRVMIA